MKSLIPTGQDYIGSGASYESQTTKSVELRFRAVLTERNVQRIGQKSLVRVSRKARNPLITADLPVGFATRRGVFFAYSGTINAGAPVRIPRFDALAPLVA